MLPGSEFNAFLRVNLRGRKPRGVVVQENYSDTLCALKEDLLALKNPRTDRAAVSEVKFSKDLYQGPLQWTLPDIFVLWANDQPIESLECPKCGLISEGLRFTDMTHSMHTEQGFAVISGPEVLPQEATEPIDLMDFTASLFYLLGEHIPDYFEGVPRVFREIGRAEIR